MFQNLRIKIIYNSMTTIKQDTIIRYYYKYETFKALLKNNNRNTKYKIKKLF